MINEIKSAIRKEEVVNFENKLISKSYEDDVEETRIERACSLISPIKPLEQ